MYPNKRMVVLEKELSLLKERLAVIESSTSQIVAQLQKAIINIEKKLSSEFLQS
ncbi:hypothetical protein [Enterobacter hormaechei]|uniref:hypothetical protein n=1 Tax=Enterobacter hormaechei TaxID=158836 RepID=UPI001889A4C0|nr:hypothetical protein [Enterobacter hormaechei]MBF1961980.1 hypothetical protein [Enterobacter hormaechei]MBF1979496.1 hypothetical protein [Enterobacter hormaechei]